MALLSTAFNRALTAELVEVYHGVLGPRLETAEWERAVRRVLEVESFFPPPAVLLRYGRADGAPQVQAITAYDEIVSAFEGGQPVGPREVCERYGEAAMEAFVSAGGSRAFAWCEPRDEPFRRKAFLEAWLDTTDQLPERALPPAKDMPRLPYRDDSEDP